VNLDELISNLALISPLAAGLVSLFHDNADVFPAGDEDLASLPGV